MKYFAQLSLEDLWTRTLQEIDFLHDEAQRNDAEMSATDLNTLSKAISVLRMDGPLSDPAAGEIGRIEDLLHAAIAQETLGFRNVFDGTNDPEHGAIGRVLALPGPVERGRRSRRTAAALSQDPGHAGPSSGQGRRGAPDGSPEGRGKRQRHG